MDFYYVNILVMSGYEGRTYSPRHLKQMAGLSYKQLYDWDAKGLLSSKREGKAGWRRFTEGQALTLLVCAEIRREFGVPVEDLALLSSQLSVMASGHLRSFLYESAPHVVYTDLKDETGMGSLVEVTGKMTQKLQRKEGVPGFIVLRVDHLIEKMYDEKVPSNDKTK